MTESGTWVPPGPSKKAIGRPSWVSERAGNRARMASTSKVGMCSAMLAGHAGRAGLVDRATSLAVGFRDRADNDPARPARRKADRDRDAPLDRDRRERLRTAHRARRPARAVARVRPGPGARLAPAGRGPPCRARPVAPGVRRAPHPGRGTGAPPPHGPPRRLADAVQERRDPPDRPAGRRRLRGPPELRVATFVAPRRRSPRTASTASGPRRRPTSAGIADYFLSAIEKNDLEVVERTMRCVADRACGTADTKARA